MCTELHKALAAIRVGRASEGKREKGLQPKVKRNVQNQWSIWVLREQLRRTQCTLPSHQLKGSMAFLLSECFCIAAQAPGPEVNLPNAMLSPWHLDRARLGQQNTATSRWPAALHTASLISFSKPIQHENIAIAQSQSHYLPPLTLTLLCKQLSRNSGQDQTCWPTRCVFVGWVPSRGCLIRLNREIHTPFNKCKLHSSLLLRCRSQSSTRN